MTSSSQNGESNLSNNLSNNALSLPIAKSHECIEMENVGNNLSVKTPHASPSSESKLAHDIIGGKTEALNENGLNGDADENYDDEKNISFLNTNASVNFEEIVKAERLAKILEVSPTHTPRVRPDQRPTPLRRRTIKHMDTGDENDDDNHRRELVLKIRKAMPLKNFSIDVRASKDLEKFLVSPVVLLDVTHTSLDRIIGDLLQKLQKDLEVDEKITAKAEKAFFTLEGGHMLGASVDNLRETIEGIRYKPEGAEPEQTWVTTVCSLPMLKRSHVGIARLRHPLNLGGRNEEVVFVIAVIAPKKEKFTKNAVEIGRTFSSLMMNSSFRHDLHVAPTEKAFKDVFITQCSRNKIDSQNIDLYREELYNVEEDDFMDYSCFQIGRGIYDDFRRRLPHYISDLSDGISGRGTIPKLISTIFFLYFACLLPAIAFGTVYEKNTKGLIGVRSCIISQVIGGLVFSFFGGQPMLIMVTTAPLALFVKGIKLISESHGIDFLALYAMVGMWNSIFLILQAIFNLSTLMKFSTRSIVDIFELFIAMVFGADAVKATMLNFQKNYHFSSLGNLSVPIQAYSKVTATPDLGLNSTIVTKVLPENCLTYDVCLRPENSILFLFLMMTTLWVGITLLRFDESQFLSATKREMLADYALPIAVLLLSFIGSFVFSDIELEKFVDNPNKPDLVFPDIYSLTLSAHLAAIGLGFSLSCLFYVDQNIAAAAINAPDNKLKKGPAYHWDLLIVGILNLPFSFFALPWVHGATPHSPLHLKALADVEQHVTNVGTAYTEVVQIRETRLTTIFSHILIGLSLLIVPVLQYVPVAVLQGVFLYICFSTLIGNQMFDRMTLFFTEGSSYPPNHYVRKVPQKKLHIFTVCQFVLLIVVSMFGFVEVVYMKMLFPIVVLLLLPLRHKILPRIIEEKYLMVLES